MVATPFELLRDKADYKRDLDIVSNAVESSALYLQLHTGKDIDTCRAFVMQTISPTGTHPLKNKQLKVLRRNEQHDRIKALVTLDGLLKQIIKTNAVLAPNMVIYDSTETNVSCTAAYVDDKMASRTIVKSIAAKAFMEGDFNTAGFCSNEEGNIKLLTNSVSGGHASPHNPHYNKTAHSSLTSLSRVATTYSNAATEKFVAGNRHYYSSDIIIENILSICVNTDYVELQAVIDVYGITIPTHAEVMQVIHRSVKFYNSSSLDGSSVEALVFTLNDLQRAAFVYTADFYHLMRFNNKLIRDFIDEMITTPAIITIDNPEQVVKGADDDTIALVGILCAAILRGGTVENMRKESEEDYLQYVSTIINIYEILEKYKRLLVCFHATDNQPTSIYEFPASIRRAVVGSDTDSTMYTVQIWVEWYFGRLAFGNEADKVANVIDYLNSHVIAHMLALASKQMGVSDKHLFRLKMKNEYGFPLYLRANRAKHYATLVSAREGNVYLVPKVDIKGVALKDSKVPKAIMKGLKEEINNVMSGLLADKGVYAHGVMQRIANLEHEILLSLIKGETKYLTFTNISGIEAYKKPMSSKFLYHDLWVNVFQQKYGRIEEPPYAGIKVSVKLDSKTLLKQYIDSLDPVTSALFKEWTKETVTYEDGIHPTTGKKILVKKVHQNKSEFTMFILPFQVFESGIPLDFTSCLNKRHIISELTAGHYILLEMLGIYYKNKNHTTMLHEDIPYRPEYGLPGDKQ